LAARGVAHINFPVDLQEQTIHARSKRNVAGYASDVSRSTYRQYPRTRTWYFRTMTA
jgi:thiamine pyrophosphate-dependent acetolactate synthase large subunit-like protein